MAAPQPTPDGSAVRTTGFRATDRPEVTDHARERWRERALEDHPDAPERVDDAWRSAVPVHYGVHNSLYVRYHVETDTLLLAERTHVRTHAETTLMTVLSREWREGKHQVKRAVAAIRRERDAR